ncbi:MAG: hypothetical protein V1897_02455 [Pseudomonadota bacterium]
MARTKDIHQFDARTFEETVSKMRMRQEDVHDAGKQHRDQTGKLHPNVDIVGKPPRVCRNAMIPGTEAGTYLLARGISLPVLSLFDGTSSTAHWLKDFFHAAERQYTLLDGVRTRYNPQLASGVVQDVYNVRHDGLPVVQMAQFESDERSADQVRLLLPASMGNDSATEDYDLGLFYALSILTDIWTFYSLKGYMTLTLDEIGRGFVSAEGVKEYLGQSGDFSRMDTCEICRQLLERWHLFILQVPTAGTYNQMLPRTSEWWAEQLGKSRVIQVTDPCLLADVRATLIYVTEASNPTKQGLVEFFRSGADKPTIDAANLEMIWRWVHQAEEHFSTQSRLPGYQDIPRPGDVFAHYRHAWPIGHPRQDENITPVESAAA